MEATVDPSALPVEPERRTIGVLARSRPVLQRAARVIRSAASLDWVAAEQDPLALRPQLAETTRLLACDAADIDLLLEWIGPRAAPSSRFPRSALFSRRAGLAPRFFPRRLLRVLRPRPLLERRHDLRP